jgi:tyrosyl-tRNA synthetase
MTISFHSFQIGGATAHVGDPSGRSTERPQLDPSVVESNTVKLSSAVSVFFNRAVQYAAQRFPSSKNLLPPEVLDNYAWHGKLNLLDFLRTAGYHSRVNVMMARER